MIPPQIKESSCTTSAHARAGTPRRRACTSCASPFHKLHATNSAATSLPAPRIPKKSRIHPQTSKKKAKRKKKKRVKPERDETKNPLIRLAPRGAKKSAEESKRGTRLCLLQLYTHVWCTRARGALSKHTHTHTAKGDETRASVQSPV